jgi:hypothetical protein
MNSNQKATEKARDAAFYVFGCLVFGPFILARPCDVAGNCMNLRQMAGPFVGLLLWGFVGVQLLELLIGGLI